GRRARPARARPWTIAILSPTEESTYGQHFRDIDGKREIALRGAPACGIGRHDWQHAREFRVGEYLTCCGLHQSTAFSSSVDLALSPSIFPNCFRCAIGPPAGAFVGMQPASSPRSDLLRPEPSSTLLARRLPQGATVTVIYLVGLIANWFGPETR